MKFLIILALVAFASAEMDVGNHEFLKAVREIFNSDGGAVDACDASVGFNASMQAGNMTGFVKCVAMKRMDIVSGIADWFGVDNKTVVQETVDAFHSMLFGQCQIGKLAAEAECGEPPEPIDCKFLGCVAGAVAKAEGCQAGLHAFLAVFGYHAYVMECPLPDGVPDIPKKDKPSKPMMDIGNQEFLKAVYEIFNAEGGAVDACDEEISFKDSLEAGDVSEFVKCVAMKRMDIINGIAEWFGVDNKTVVQETQDAFKSMLFGKCKIGKLAAEAECGEPPEPIDCKFLGCVEHAVATADACQAGHHAFMAVFVYHGYIMDCPAPKEAPELPTECELPSPAMMDVGNREFLKAVHEIFNANGSAVDACDEEIGFDASLEAGDMSDFVKCVAKKRMDIVSGIADWFGVDNKTVIKETIDAFHSMLFGECKIGRLAAKAECGKPPEPIDCRFLGCVAHAVATADACQAGLHAFMAVFAYHGYVMECPPPPTGDVPPPPTDDLPKPAMMDVGNQEFLKGLYEIFGGKGGACDACDEEFGWEESLEDGDLTDIVECVAHKRMDVISEVAEWYKTDNATVIAELVNALHSMMFGDCKIGKLAGEAHCGEPPEPIDCLFLECVADAVLSADACQSGYHVFESVFYYHGHVMECPPPANTTVV